jgi:hypothetical protein
MCDARIVSRLKPALLIVGLAAWLAACESDADKLKRLRAEESMLQIRVLDYGLMAATGAQLPDSILRDRRNALDSLPIVRAEIQRLQR